MVSVYNLDLFELDKWYLDLNTSIELHEILHHYNRSAIDLKYISEKQILSEYYWNITSIVYKTIIYILVTLVAH